MILVLSDIYICNFSGYVYLLCLDPNTRETVCLKASGYTPYFFVHNTDTDSSYGLTRAFAERLSTELAEHLAQDKGTEIAGVDVVHQKLLFKYSPSPYYLTKVYARSPTTLCKCAVAIKKNYNNCQLYESKKDLRLALLRENNISVFGFLSVEDTSVRQVTSASSRFSRCHRDFTCRLTSVKPYTPTDTTTFPPFCFGCYDIETTGLNANKHSVFQVSLCLRQFPFSPNDTVTKIIISSIPMDVPDENAEQQCDFTVETVPDEKTLLSTFYQRLVDYSVLVLAGWNNLGFDAPFLYNRAKANNCVQVVDKLSFLKPHVSRLKLQQRSLDSSAFGTNHFHTYTGCYGLVEIDGMLMLKKSSSVKMNSYKLNSVAQELLNSSKDDVHYSDILHAVNTRDRQAVYKVAKYCVQDSLLVMQIFEHLKEVENAIAMASLTNVPLQYIVERGQCVKCVSLVFGEAYKQNLVWNNVDKPSQEQSYQGSTVIDSVTGLYTSPVAVMDFNSLYPSIMTAYNLSPETLVGTTDRQWSGDPQDISYTEGSRLYVYIGSKKYAVFETAVPNPTIPSILRKLVAERKAVRKVMAQVGETDVPQTEKSLRLSQLNAKQLALKIMANSVYGTCGFGNGPLPLVEIAAATTAIGRKSINTVKSELAKLGYPDVVAGDTDSVMLHIKGVNVKTAIVTAKQLCDHLNKLFLPPMKIEFEKVYKPYLVLTKKRYAGLLWVDEHSTPKRDTKGIATKRRDVAPLVQSTVSDIINKLLWSQDVEGAVHVVQSVLLQMITQRLPVEELTVRKELKKRPCDYSTPTPHSSTASKMIKRDPEHAPKLGERVAYVIVRGNGDISSRAEEPERVREYDMNVDYLYYLQNQLQNPVQEIFNAVKDDKYSTMVSKMFNDTARQLMLQQSRQRSITDYLKRSF